MRHNTDPTVPQSWRHALWLTVLVAASVAFSLGLACAVPFAAFGAATALTLNRRDALLLTGALWLANQAVGFAFLGYPWDVNALSWSPVLLAVALLSTIAARATAARLSQANTIAVWAASFAAAFIAYEASLYLVSVAWLGGTDAYTPAIVLQILEINALAFVGLLVLNRLDKAMGLSKALPLAAQA